MPKNFFEGDKPPGTFGKSSKDDAMKAYLAANPDVAAEISIDVTGVTEAAAAVSNAAASVKTSLDAMGAGADKNFVSIQKAADSLTSTLGDIDEVAAAVKKDLGSITGEQIQQTFIKFDQVLKSLRETNQEVKQFQAGLNPSNAQAGSSTVRLFNTELNSAKINVIGLKNEIARLPDDSEAFQSLTEELFQVDAAVQDLESNTKELNAEFEKLVALKDKVGSTSGTASPIKTNSPIDFLFPQTGGGIPLGAAGGAGGGGGINNIPPMLENPEEPLGKGSKKALVEAKAEFADLKVKAEAAGTSTKKTFKDLGEDAEKGTEKATKGIQKTTESMKGMLTLYFGLQSLSHLLHDLGLPGEETVRVIGQLTQVNQLIAGLSEGIGSIGLAFTKMPSVIGNVAREVEFLNALLGGQAATGLAPGIAAAAAVLIPLIALFIALQPAISAFNAGLKQSKEILHEAIAGVNAYYTAIREGTKDTVAAQIAKNKADLAEVETKLNLQKKSRDNSFIAEQNNPSIGGTMTGFFGMAASQFGVPMNIVKDAIARVEFGAAQFTDTLKEQDEEIDTLTKKQKELTGSLNALTNAYNANEIVIRSNQEVQKRHNEELVAGIMQWADSIKKFRDIAKNASADQVRDLIAANIEDQHITQDKIDRLNDSTTFSKEEAEALKLETKALENLKKEHIELTGLLLQEAILRDEANAGIKDIENSAKSLYEAEKLARDGSVEKVNDIIREKEDQLRLNNEEIEALRNSGYATEYTTQKIKELSAANKILAGDLENLIKIAGPGASLNDAIERGKKVADVQAKFREDSAKTEATRKLAESRALDDYQRNREKAITDQNNKVSRADSDYADNRAKKIRDHNLEIDKIDDEAKADRNKLNTEYNQETIRKEEDLQAKLRQIREDAANRIREAAAMLDAKSVLNIMKATDLKLKQEQDGAVTERTRRRQEFDDKMKDIDTEAAEEKQKRQAQFALELADADAQRAKERERDQLDFARKLDEQAEQFRIAKNRRYADYALQDAERLAKFNADISAIRANNAKLTAEFDRGLNELTTHANNWANGLRNFTIPPPPQNSVAYNPPPPIITTNQSSYAPGAGQSRQTTQNNPLAGFLGGVVNFAKNLLGFDEGTPMVPGHGIYELHDGESVNDPSTSDLLRRVLGSNYSQSDLQSLIAGGTGGASLHWQGDIITGDLGGHSKDELRNMFTEIVNHQLIRTFQNGRVRPGV